MIDSRVAFFISAIATATNMHSEEVTSLLKDILPIKRFLNERECISVFTFLWDKDDFQKELFISNSFISDKKTPAITVAFIKASGTKDLSHIEVGDLKSSVMVISAPVSGRSLQDFEPSFNSLFTPALTDRNCSEVLSPQLSEKIKKMILELNHELTSLSGHSHYVDNFTFVRTPMEEIRFWEKLRDDDKTNHPAKMICDFFSSIKMWFATIEAEKSGEDELDFVQQYTSCGDKVESCLLNVYRVTNRKGKHVYSSKRMVNTMDAIMSTIFSFICRILPPHPRLFTDSFLQIKVALLQIKDLITSIMDIFKKLTTIDFCCHDLNIWTEGPYCNCSAEKLCLRLDTILQLRSTHQEMRKILSKNRRYEFELLHSFEAFMAHDPLQMTLCTDQWFENAVESYESSLLKIDTFLTDNIKCNIIIPFAHSPLLLISMLKQYSSLIKRPNIKALLISIMNDLENKLDHIINGMIDDLDSECDSVAKIFKSRRLISKAMNIEEVHQTLGMNNDINFLCQELCAKCKRSESDSFREWTNDMRDTLGSYNEFFMNDKLIDIDKNGILHVNFIEPLRKFIREARQLSELGFTLPKEIEQKCHEGQNFYHYVVILKRIANFYNSVENYLIPEQKSMLLESLTEFKEIVNNPKPIVIGDASVSSDRNRISWGNTTECDHYIKSLHKASEKLKIESNNLCSLHQRLGNMVTILITTDMLSQKSLWMKRLDDIKGVIEKGKEKYSLQSMSQWVKHWNHQIYKAMEINYISGLEVLHERINELKCELVCVDDTLQIKPDISTLRENYYAELSLFIELPCRTRGIFGSKIFENITLNSFKSIHNVYIKTEYIFKQLENTLVKNSNWTALHSLDVQALVREHCKNLNNFVDIFSILKMKSLDLQKVPDYQILGACKLSTSAFKHNITIAINDLHDKFLKELHSIIIRDFGVVDNFLLSSMKTFKSVPSTIEGIIDTQIEFQNIIDKQKNIRELSIRCEEKTKLALQQISRSNVVDNVHLQCILADLNHSPDSRWALFDFELERFNDDIAKQRESTIQILHNDEKRLKRRIEDFGNSWKSIFPANIEDWTRIRIDHVLSSLKSTLDNFNTLKLECNKLTKCYKSYELNAPVLDNIGDLESELEISNKVWLMVHKYMLQYEEICSKNWIQFRENIFDLDDFSKRWGNTIGDLNEKEQLNGAIVYLKKELEMLEKSLPSIKFCVGEPFREDHWGELLQGKLNLPRNLRLENLLCSHFMNSLKILSDPSMFDFLKSLYNRAQSEVNIRESLQEITSWSQTMEMNIFDHVFANRQTVLVKNWRETFIDIGDKQCVLSNLKGSSYFTSFVESTETLENKLSFLTENLQLLYNLQTKWIYLEPIFLRGTLPNERHLFDRIDEGFRDITARIRTSPKLFNLVDDNIHIELNATLRGLAQQADQCQNALHKYLEEKRAVMPRFYFLCDDDLLELLGQCKNSVVIQKHLLKLFQALYSISIDESNLITAINSSEGESVPLMQPIAITNNPEEWFAKLSYEQNNTLQDMLSSCSKKVRSMKYLTETPSQIINVAEKIKFTLQVETSLQKREGLDEYNDQLLKELQQLTSMNAKGQSLLDLKLKALVLDTINNRDILDHLIKNGIQTKNDWIWQKQMRYYASGVEKGVHVVQMSCAQLQYTFEYQGNQPKLIHTPLTEKCYLTLALAVKYGFGGNPYGPAGTGKTETVKSLGGVLGRRVIVFNCDEGIDFAGMSRIFIGIVQSGSWGCFDEFNRLKEDQLSVISQDIQRIQNAIKQKNESVQLLGKYVKVDLTAGIFVTLNPVGKHYGGRSNIPENLKVLFRPIAMDKPDIEIICEIFLYAEGFTWSQELGKNITCLFSLSKQLLSIQRHHDWGLRSLKTILETAGSILSEKRNLILGTFSKSDELKILIKAIRINILSKLDEFDTVKFLELISDVFPDSGTPDNDNIDFKKIIRDVMINDLSLCECDEQEKKVLQLKETMRQRNGCIIVGSPGCGKSTVLEILKTALVKNGHGVVIRTLNPKAMTRKQLIGSLDRDTREWQDGVLTNVARKAAKDPPHILSWVVCDGDIDPEWIESLNSVLDDNKILTLPSGERILFGSNVSFVFETHDLRFASPATISRMGVIFFGIQDVAPRIISRWLKSLSEISDTDVPLWMDKHFSKALDIALKTKMVIDTTSIGTILNGLSHVKKCSNESDFLHGLICGLGANMPYSSRVKFSQRVLSWGDKNEFERLNTLDMYSENNEERITPFERPIHSATQSETNIILTKHVQRAKIMLRPWIDGFHSFLLIGPNGCGKATILRHLFSQCENVQLKIIYCSSRTGPEVVRLYIKEMCSLFTASDCNIYRPKNSQRLVLILTNIDYPQPDQYGSSMLISFLQYLVTYNGFYDTESQFVRVENIQIVLSMNIQQSLEGNQLSRRFSSKLKIGVVDHPDHDDMIILSSSFLTKGFSSKLRIPREISDCQCRKQVATTMVEVLERTYEEITTKDNQLYVFSPKTLSLWSDGLLRYESESKDFLSYFVHEAYRQFSDRLVDENDKKKFQDILKSVMYKNWGYSFKNDFNIFYTAIEKKYEPGLTTFPRCLRPLYPDLFLKVVEDGIKYFQREREMNIVLFPEFLQNLAKVDHILTRDDSNILLVGKCGIGKRTTVRLVCFLNQMKLVSPTITKGYSIQKFKIILKQAIHTAAIENEVVCLFVEDHHLTEAAILDALHSMISSSEVPGLYKADELAALLSLLKDDVISDGNLKSTYDLFHHRVKKNLKICLAMDPTTKQFFMCCDQNPAFLRKSHVVWMGEWKEDTLRDICRHDEEFKKMTFVDTKSQRLIRKEEGFRSQLHSQIDLKENFVNVIVDIHSSMISNGATPLDIFKLLSVWKRLFDERTKDLQSELHQLLQGIEKITKSKTAVDKLKEDTKEQKLTLKAAQADADEAMETITETLGRAESTRRETEEIKIKLSQQATTMSARKIEIQNKLGEILPILQQAKDAVKGIKRDNLNEIRSLKSPPSMIVDVLSGVLMLLGMKDLSWISMKKFLGNRGVKNEILNFDVTKTNSCVVKSVDNLLKSKSKSFDDKIISHVSVAAAPLAAWVKANLEYVFIIENVRPLEEEHSAADAEITKGQERLKACEEELYKNNELVSNLKMDFSNRTRQAETYRMDLIKTESRLSSAESLLGNLCGEQKRWMSKANSLEGELEAVGAHSLLSSSFIVYLGKVKETLREEKIQEWSKFFEEQASCSDFEMIRAMGAEHLRLKWKSWLFPDDKLSQENAYIMTILDEKIPFIIDPEQICTSWINKYFSEEREMPLEYVQSEDSRLISKIELCVRLGKVLIITDAKRIEPILYPLIRRDFTLEGSTRRVVSLGEKVVDFSEDFRLLFMTRNTDIALPPDTKHVYEINFTVTNNGLEENLLNSIVCHEEPELNESRIKVEKDEQENRMKLLELEKSLIESLSMADDDLLENDSLIETLSKTKESANKVKLTLEAIKAIREKVTEKREIYRKSAKDGSKLFFLISQIHVINHMYRFSLSTFMTLFQANLRDSQSKKTGQQKSHLCNLQYSLLRKCFLHVGRSLFKKDRPLFALHLIRGMKVGTWDKNSWDVFTGRLVGTSLENGPKCPSWAEAERKNDFLSLCQHCPNVVKTLDLENSKWQSWARNSKNENCFPTSIRISAFEKLLVIKTFRPDRLMDAITKYCCEELSIDSLTPGGHILAQIWEETKNTNKPVLLITQGADPSHEIEELANKTVGKEMFKSLSLGGGQEGLVAKQFQEASQRGFWICLKNLHLAIEWLPELEQIYTGTEKAHQNFKLWLTTEQHIQFPGSLLELSFKVAFETPPGIKQNIQRSLSLWGDDFIEKEIGQKKNRSKLLFLLAWFHALVQERNEYSCQGWSKRYDFNTGDLRAGAFLIDDLTQEIDWNMIHGMIMGFVYGGRVNNLYDQRILHAYVKKYFCEEVVSGYRTIAPGVIVPDKCDRNSIHKTISMISDYDNPSIFGLPQNIDGSIQRSRGNMLISELRKIDRVVSTENSFDQKKWNVFFSPILETWSKLKTCDNNSVWINLLNEESNGRSHLDNEGSKSTFTSIDSYLEKEKAFGIKLFHQVDHDLNLIEKTVPGTKQFSGKDSSIRNQLMQGCTPNQWRKDWNGPDNVFLWLERLMEVTRNICECVSKGSKISILAAQIEMHLFFDPLSLLYAFRQFTARVQNCSIQDLKLSSKWQPNISKSNTMNNNTPTILLLKGLLIQGAQFVAEKNKIEEATMTTKNLTAMPTLCVSFVPKLQPDEKIGGCYNAPVYDALSRENLVCEFPLPCSESEITKFILAGVALFISE